MTEDSMHRTLREALARNSGPSAEDVEGRAFAAEEIRDRLTDATDLSYGDRNRAAWALVDWLTAHTAAAEARGAGRGARAVVEAVARMVAEWGEVVPPLDPPSAAVSILAAAREAAAREERAL